MITRYIAIAFIVLISIQVRGQLEKRNTLNARQVTSMLNLLHSSKDATTRFRVQVRLVKHMLEKGLQGKLYKDSIYSLIRKASDINAVNLQGKENGLILLYEAMIARRNLQPDTATQLVQKAAAYFKSSKDHFRLVETYLELSRHYNTNDPQQVVPVKRIIDSVYRLVPTHITPDALDSCMATLKNFYTLYMYPDNPVIKLYYLDKFVQSCLVLKDKNREFWARKEKAYAYYGRGQLDTAIKHLTAVAGEQKAGNYPFICHTYRWLGFYYYIATDYKNAMLFSLEATRHIRDAADSAYTYQIYQSVAVICKQMGNPGEAIEWNQKIITYMKATGDYTGLYSTIADLIRDMLPVGRAKEALKIILDNCPKNPPTGVEDSLQFAINRSQVYLALSNNAAAEKYTNELVQMLEKLAALKERTSDNVPEELAYIHLANYYMKTGKYEKSEAYFSKALKGWPPGAQVQGREYEHRFRYRLDSAKGNFLSAFENFKTWHKILDSALSVAKAKEFDQIQTAYKTAQKDSLITFKEQNIQLLTRQDVLQKTKLQQGIIIRNIILTIAALLVLVMILLFSQYRLKQRTNRKLQLQQEEISQQNIFLQHLVDEKDWLVKEIHHRVKNNLQIVMSLLNSQSAFLDNETALTAIHASQRRVHAMALIHQKLYNTENTSAIDMNVYIRELVSFLADSFDTRQRIRFDLQIAPLLLDVSQAVPLGLILNEAITNSLKYAFPTDRQGVIILKLSNTHDHHYLLEISDNGNGMVPQHQIEKAGSLGMTLMAGLSHDLDGSFSVENNNGVTIKVSFEQNLTIHRPDIFKLSANVTN